MFDHPIDPAAVREFLSEPRHHIAVAIENGLVVGFVSGVHYVHPDKPKPELWINEVSVASTHRRSGLARALLEAVLGVGRELGCKEAWVLTDRGNPAAMGLYASCGAIEDSPDAVMFTFKLEP